MEIKNFKSLSFYFDSIDNTDYWYSSEVIFVNTKNNGVLFGHIIIDVSDESGCSEGLNDILKNENVIKIYFTPSWNKHNESQEEFDLDLTEIKEFKKIENIFK